MTRPYVLLSCAMSIDGYIDDGSASRLLLSSEADLDQIDALRASCDAILVGAGTIRADNPRLLIRSARRRAARAAAGRQPDPLRVVLTTAGVLDPAAAVFTAGQARTIVYVASHAVRSARARLGDVATVTAAGDPADPGRVLADLNRRGVRRLMVEGGSSVHARFLADGLADELRLAIAPLFVGDPAAPRFTGRTQQPPRLTQVSTVGGMAVLRYALSARCEC